MYHLCFFFIPFPSMYLIYHIFIPIQAFKERAESDLKKAADQHWSDGALEVVHHILPHKLEQLENLSNSCHFYCAKKLQSSSLSHMSRPFFININMLFVYSAELKLN